MSPIRAEDLPKHLRVRLGVGAPPKASRAGIGHAAPCPGRCVGCGARFERYSRYERHPCAVAGGARWAIDVPGARR